MGKATPKRVTGHTNTGIISMSFWSVPFQYPITIKITMKKYRSKPSGQTFKANAMFRGKMLGPKIHRKRETKRENTLNVLKQRFREMVNA